MSISLAGKRIGGRYEVHEMLGEGGMAEVYEAVDPRLGRKVAVKLLHRHLSSDSQFQTRFEREAQAIARLEHPHIIQVYDFDRDEELRQFYMVIEYIEGPTLSEYVRKDHGGSLPLGETLRIMEDLSSALGYAHSENMQHRDIKPSNVMMDKGSRAVLTDFGIAKLFKEGENLTASGAMIGTPAYISPEQANGLPGDHRSDIYSMGIMFYQLVTGRLPYEGDTPISIILKHLQEVPAPPTVHNPSLPPGVEAIILRCIAKDPADRFQTAEELLHNIRNLDIAASQLDSSRTLSMKAYNRGMNTTPSTPYAPTTGTRPVFDEPLTDTLATAPRRTSLLIGIGAVAIIALMALGAILFSTAGTENKPDGTEDVLVNACVLVLEENVFARTDPIEDTAATFRFDAGDEIEILDFSNEFVLIDNGEQEGWVADSVINAPAECQIE